VDGCRLGLGLLLRELRGAVSPSIALATVREFHFTVPVENGGRDQPFAIWLSFLDPLVRREDFLCDFYLQQSVAARTFAIIEWPV